MSMTAEQLEAFVSSLAATPERWAHLVAHRDDTRVYEQVWDGEDVNAWLICWSADQDTGFHDHDDSSAAIAVLSGEVREDRLRVGGEPVSRTLTGGSVFTVPATVIHRVLHAGDGPSVTIHAYSPPLARTGAYRVDSDGELRREPQALQDELRAAPALA